MAKKTGEKYDAIIEAAIKVIARHGYYHAQVSKIAKEANVADGTIYLYFENKSDVLISVFREKMGKMIRMCEEKLKNLQSPEEKLKAFIELHLSTLARDKDYAIVTQIELRQSDEKIRQGIGESLKKYFDIIDAVVQEGIEKGIFRNDVEIRTIRRMVFGTLDQFVTAWVMKSGKYDLVSQTDDVYKLLLHGLRG